MRIVYLPTLWTVVLDCIAWAVIQTGMAYLSLRLPASVLQPEGWVYRARAWERDGEIYQKILRVRRWKDLLPSGGTWFAGGFSLREVASHDLAYLRRWALESCRAELCHWAAIAPSVLFFLWNPWYVGLIMILYALAFNLPLVVVQRYNRPRLLDILARQAKRHVQPREGSVSLADEARVSRGRFRVLVEEGPPRGDLYEFEQVTYFRLVDTHTQEVVMTWQGELEASLSRDSGTWSDYRTCGVRQVSLADDERTAIVQYHDGREERVRLPE